MEKSSVGILESIAKGLPGYEDAKEIMEWFENLMSDFLMSKIELPAWTKENESTGLLYSRQRADLAPNGAKFVVPVTFHKSTTLRAYCHIASYEGPIELNLEIPFIFDIDKDVISKFELLSISLDRKHIIYRDSGIWFADVDFSEQKKIASNGEQFVWCGNSLAFREGEYIKIYDRNLRTVGMGTKPAWSQDCKLIAYINEGVWLTDRDKSKKVYDGSCDVIEWLGPNIVCSRGMERYLLRLGKKEKRCLKIEKIDKGIRTVMRGDVMWFEGDIPQWFGVELGTKDGMARKGDLRGVWSVRYEAGNSSYTDFIFIIDSSDPNPYPRYQYTKRPIIAIHSDIENKPQDVFMCKEDAPTNMEVWEKAWAKLPEICKGPLGFTSFDQVDVADLDCDGRPEIFGFTSSIGGGATIYQPFVYRYQDGKLELLFTRKILAKDEGMWILDEGNKRIDSVDLDKDFVVDDKTVRIGKQIYLWKK